MPEDQDELLKRLAESDRILREALAAGENRDDANAQAEAVLPEK